MPRVYNLMYPSILNSEYDEMYALAILQGHGW